ncbi:TniQ family protein (plasmid) [Brucella anthropi]|nr:TniQ family protein [Brucella anthropi]
MDSYVRRLAERYQISVRTFCRSGLGSEIDLDIFADNPDRKPLMKLSAGTGLTISKLRKMTRTRSERRLMIALREFCRNHPEEVQKMCS